MTKIDGVHLGTLIQNFARNWPPEGSELAERYEEWLYKEGKK